MVLIGLAVDWREARWVLTAACVAGVALEMLRLQRRSVRDALAKAVPVFRPDEAGRASGAFWLLVGYAAASWIPVPGPTSGILAAALADPAASMVGSRWGRGARKSWVGTVAAWVVAAMALTAIGLPLGVALVGAFVAAGLERWPGPFDDNLLIAPGVAASVWLVI